MSKKLFGTDGIRGVANKKLTPELAFKIGQAAGLWVLKEGQFKRVVLGRDTRRSGPMLGAALASGFCSVGVDVLTMGIVPTGCISFTTMNQEFDLGAVISASHNPAQDNGIKLISHDGKKLSEEGERWIEEQIDHIEFDRPEGGLVGRLDQDETYKNDYEKWLISIVPEKLEGLKVVLDCSHGAAYDCAPRVFRKLGATVSEMGVNPDGMNINAECGATKPSAMLQMASQSCADIGIAFDGDADRAVFGDSQNRLINGDRTMAIWCGHWSQFGEFDPAVVVGTVMTNGGFEAYLQSRGAKVERTDVGDKYVSAKLRELGAKIGGEQSGHIIFPDLLPTGDGLVTALQVCRVLKREQKNAKEFFDDYETWPQILINVTVDQMEGWNENIIVQNKLKEASENLMGQGRINVRASGTQPMIRVMVEADNFDLRDRVANAVVSTLIAELGGSIYSQVDLTHALGD